MRKIFLILAMAAGLLLGACGSDAQETEVNKAIVVLDDVLVGHAPSLLGQFRLPDPMSAVHVIIGMGYYEGYSVESEVPTKSFLPKVGLLAGRDGFFGYVMSYPTAGENEWPIEYGLGYDAAVADWVGIRVRYGWYQEKNIEEIEYVQTGLTGELGVGLWFNVF